jgi:hypothetical protein
MNFPNIGTARRKLLTLAVVLSLAVMAVFLWKGRDETASGAIGSIDQPIAEILDQTRFVVSGWALDRDGIRKVEAVLDGAVVTALRFGLPRQDVQQVHPGYPDSATAGFEGHLDLTGRVSGHHFLEVVATDGSGRRTVLARKHVIGSADMRRWLPFLRHAPTPDQVFHVLFATSGVAHGGANEIAELYAPYNSRTIRAGLRVPILYLRNTKGKAKDWKFDPDFGTSRQCGQRSVADDNLSSVIGHAVAKDLPVLLTLNGGIWADAACDIPEWDVNDALEAEPLNCQWNERDQVMPDDYLKHLPGSLDAPELARALTLNVYAREVRRYKKRNLQLAARLIADFSRRYPQLFVGINLDPDLYMNPFFGEAQWYDYNPDTLRQFREWLQGVGPYSGRSEPGVPDLSAYRRKRPLTLLQVNALSDRKFKSWDGVQPPRQFPKLPVPYWTDPWVREWEQFRRHLVDLHYDELSRWVAEAGIPRRQIFSSQGFIAPHALAKPFAIRLDSPVKNYDSGGMTVEGAKPSHGHLGAIIYGPSAVNDIRMEGKDSLFATFRRIDPGWAVVEHNTSDFRAPKELATFAAGYRSMRDIYNYGARFVSPMAWNGSNGLSAGQPGFAAFTALRNTPLEEAIREFMLSQANLPRGALYWGFGTDNHADGDGWSLQGTGTLRLLPGMLELRPARDGEIVLVSGTLPPLDIRGYRHLVLEFTEGVSLRMANLQVLDAQGRTQSLNSRLVPAPAGAQPGARLLELSSFERWPAARQLRLRLALAPGMSTVKLNHLALLP